MAPPDTARSTQARKERAAIASIAASAGLALAKGIAAILSGSLALLAEALHGLADVAATILTWFAVRLSAKPADDEHPFGHGKAESVAALIEVGLLVAIAVYTLVEGVSRLIGSNHEVAVFSWIAVGVVGLAITVDVWRVASLKRIAKETGSHALEADALHFASDLWSSGAVLVGFAAIAFGFPWGDAIAALVVGGIILLSAVGLGRRTIDALMDASPPGASDRVRDVVASLPGVAAVDAVRLRQVGATTHGDVTIGVSRTLSPDRIAAIQADVAAAICDLLPDHRIHVTAHPRSFGDETVLERVLLIAAAKRIPVHHVTAQTIDGRLSVALDVEVDGRLSLEAAHTIASRIETAIRETFGSDTEVETHIEPLEPRPLDGVDAPEAIRDAVLAAIRAIGPDHPSIHDVHDVRVRTLATGADGATVVILHFRAAAKARVDEVHAAADAFERDLKSRVPELSRVISHAEPVR